MFHSSHFHLFLTLSFPLGTITVTSSKWITMEPVSTFFLQTSTCQWLTKSIPSPDRFLKSRPGSTSECLVHIPSWMSHTRQAHGWTQGLSPAPLFTSTAHLCKWQLHGCTCQKLGNNSSASFLFFHILVLLILTSGVMSHPSLTTSVSSPSGRWWWWHHQHHLCSCTPGCHLRSLH